MTKTLITIFTLFAFSANAFYTTFNDDMAKLREGIYKQAGTTEQKEAFIKNLEPTIMQARIEAFERVSNGCAADIERVCPKYVDNTEKAMKCISENRRMLTTACKYTIMQNFRTD